MRQKYITIPYDKYIRLTESSEKPPTNKALVKYVDGMEENRPRVRRDTSYMPNKTELSSDLVAFSGHSQAVKPPPAPPSVKLGRVKKRATTKKNKSTAWIKFT